MLPPSSDKVNLSDVVDLSLTPVRCKDNDKSVGNRVRYSLWAFDELSQKSRAHSLPLGRPYDATNLRKATLLSAT